MPTPGNESENPSSEDDPIARMLADWAPVIEDMAAACSDDEAQAGAARARLAPFLQQMGQTEDWRALVEALRRILAGERDEESLVWDLDAMDHLIVDAVLERLGAGPEEDDEPTTEHVTLDELLALVAQACQPDERDLNAQMYVSARRMAEAKGAPVWQGALGRVLMAVLDGERDVDLSALPEALAEKVRAIALGRGEGETR